MFGVAEEPRCAPERKIMLTPDIVTFWDTKYSILCLLKFDVVFLDFITEGILSQIFYLGPSSYFM